VAPRKVEPPRMLALLGFGESEPNGTRKVGNAEFLANFDSVVPVQNGAVFIYFDWHEDATLSDISLE
jgi:hypothetical protein